LAKAVPTLDLAPRNAIQKDRSLANVVKHFYPRTPKLEETIGKENPIKGLLADGVKCLTEVNLKTAAGAKRR
jgi:hypothetical protein